MARICYAQLIIPFIAAGLLAGCLHAQRPVRFEGPAALALEVLARELTAQGLEPAELDEPRGLLRTRWQNLSFLYGEIDGREATLWRRYAIVVQRRPGDSLLTVRMEVRACRVGTRVDVDNELVGACNELPGLMEDHQAELERLGAELEAALGRLRPSPEADLRTAAVVALFDLQAPPGLLPAGAGVRLTDYFAAALAKTGWFQVVPRQTLAAAMRDKQTESYAAGYDQATQIALGRAVAARKLIVVQLVGGGGACTLAGTLYDIERQAADGAATVQTGCSEQQLPTGLEALARELADRIQS